MRQEGYFYIDVESARAIIHWNWTLADQEATRAWRLAAESSRPDVSHGYNMKRRHSSLFVPLRLRSLTKEQSATTRKPADSIRLESRRCFQRPLTIGCGNSLSESPPLDQFNRIAILSDVVFKAGKRLW
jgi:hypothetical protein